MSLCISQKSTIAMSIVIVTLYINIYTFSRRFYPKRLTVHSGYTFSHQYVWTLSSLSSQTAPLLPHLWEVMQFLSWCYWYIHQSSAYNISACVSLCANCIICEGEMYVLSLHNKTQFCGKNMEIICCFYPIVHYMYLFDQCCCRFWLFCCFSL